jgi:predicted amidohydrolase
VSERGPLKAHLSRWVCLDPASNLDRAAAEAQEAAQAGADLVVFPESFLHGYARTVVPDEARDRFGRISGSHPGTLFAFGSFSEGGRNRMTLWSGGQEAARYDKVHLFAPNGERELWQAGDRYAALCWRGWTLGLLNCNDVRFPEQARALALRAHCDVLLAVAWWPWRRDHVWRTLLRARAIENGAWVLGCCVAASRYPGEEFAGAGNYVFDPHGEPVRTADDRTYLLDPSRVPGLVVDPRQDHVDIKDIEFFEGDLRGP